MSPLRIANFRRLWFAGLISDTGDWLLLVSLPIVVYQYTGSTLGTSAAFLVELIPPVALAPIAGRGADRPDRRRALILVSIAQAALLTPLLLVGGRAGLPIVYAVIAVQSALAALFDPTKNALLPTLVDERQLVPANALVGLGQNSGRLLGASLGGVLLATGGGLSTIVTVDAASFLLAVVLIARIVLPSASGRPGRAPAGPARGGWRATLAGRSIRAALAVLYVSSVAQGIFVVLFVVFVARSLRGGPAEIGLLRGVQAAGSIAGALLLATRSRLTPGKLATWALIGFGLLCLAIWNAPRLSLGEPLYVALFIAVGVPGVGLATGLTSALQQGTVEGQRGKAFAAMGAAMAVGEASGIVAAGLLGDTVGVVPVLDAQGVLYLIAGLLAARWLLPGRARRAGPTERECSVLERASGRRGAPHVLGVGAERLGHSTEDVSVDRHADMG